MYSTPSFSKIKPKLGLWLPFAFLLLASCATQQGYVDVDPPVDEGLAAVESIDIIDELTDDQLSQEDTEYQPLERNINDLVLRAFDLVNIGYRYGGNNPKEGFDCSGFVKFLYDEQLGVNLPRTTRQIRYSGRAVRKNDLLTGDLVFFNTQGRPYSHVGVYIGEGRFVHAPRSGAKIRIESLKVRYWASRYNGARRVVEEENPLLTLGSSN